MTLDAVIKWFLLALFGLIDLGFCMAVAMFFAETVRYLVILWRKRGLTSDERYEDKEAAVLFGAVSALALVFAVVATIIVIRIGGWT